jgi:hypothetical protein
MMEMKLSQALGLTMDDLINQFFDLCKNATDIDHQRIVEELREKYKDARQNGNLKEASLETIILYLESEVNNNPGQVFAQPQQALDDLKEIKSLVEAIEAKTNEMFGITQADEIQTLKTELAKSAIRIDKLEQQVADVLADRKAEKTKNAPLLGMFTMKR